MSSRRCKVRHMLALFLVLSLVAAACGNDDDATTSAGDDDTAASADDDDATASGDWDPDGEYTVAWIIGATHFDPHIVGPQNSFYPFLSPIYDRLTMLTADGQVAPMLATSWEFIEEGTILELELREGVEFHDGEPFDAEAVAANIDRAKTHPESTTSAEQLEPVTDVEVVDEHTVRLHVTEDAGALPFNFTTTTGMMVSPAAMDDPDLSTNPVGAGPYVIESSEDDRTVYVRAPGEYWDPEAQKAARFTLLGISDETARVNAIQTGEADMIDVHLQENVDQAKELAEGDDFDLVQIPAVTVNSIFFNRDSEALQDIRVRQAINHAINREAIRDDLLEGDCIVTDQPLHPDWDGYDPELVDHYEYDPDRARELLDEAGVSDLTLDVVGYVGAEPAQTIALIVQEELAEIGITVNLDSYEPNEAIERWQEGNSDAFVTFGGSLPEPGFALERRIDDPPGDLANFSPELVELRDELFNTQLSPEERTELLAEANREIIESASGIYMCFSVANILTTSRMVGTDNIPYGMILIYDTRYLGVSADGG